MRYLETTPTSPHVPGLLKVCILHRGIGLRAPKLRGITRNVSCVLLTGNPKLEDDLFYTQCWDDSKSIMVRVGDSCPCQYPIKGPDGKVAEVRTQNWCCGGNNHFDLSFWAFEQLAHPTYGVMPIEYRPVNCETREPLRWVRVRLHLLLRQTCCSIVLHNTADGIWLALPPLALFGACILSTALAAHSDSGM